MKKPMDNGFASEKTRSNSGGDIGIVGSIPVISPKQKTPSFRELTEKTLETNKTNLVEDEIEKY